MVPDRRNEFLVEDVLTSTEALSFVNSSNECQRLADSVIRSHFDLFL